MGEWNPELYLKFKNERTQPAKDLISRIEINYPERVLDIGCGPGNSSNELRKRWRRAEILGLDSSREMIEKAIREYRDINFVLADATGDISYLGKFDIIFSNAAMQWMAGIETLLPGYFEMLNPNGILAMQIPNPSTMPIMHAIEETATMPKWGNVFNKFNDGLHLYEPEKYYDMLCRFSNEVDVWETHYHHIMPGHEAIIEWYSSTGMKPYLELLDDEEKEGFASDVLSLVKLSYPTQVNGTVLFPFRRIFFTCKK